MLKLKLVIPPTLEPVTLSDIRPQYHLDQSDTSMDDQISPLIVPARVVCEKYQNRAYLTQTLELALDCWPSGGMIKLPKAPLQSVTSVIYTDSSGAPLTWSPSSYIIDDYSEPAQLVKINSWPSVSLAAVNGIKIRYVVGWTDAASVSAEIKQAIILLVLYWMDNGMCDPPEAVTSLLALERIVPI